MREIKFRAWNKEVNRYSKPFTLLGDVLNYTDDDGLGVVKSLTNEKVEQFTGLQDKNGKDIYEGDILDFEPYEWNRGSMKHESEWEFPMWEVAWDEKDGAWNTGGGTTSECSVYKSIKGNIHETPELIE